MNKLLTLTIFTLVFYSCLLRGESETLQEGQLQKNANDETLVWNAMTNSWMTPESFWQEYGNREGGKHWGRSKEYPVYSQVNELDTLIIEVENGACLMEFWHGRWRRANAVRRWHTAFDEYSGCPYVFD
ncbi:MAG: hypothetical protein ACI9SC_001391 [Gammaproteobacteria bacterium]|jgi:hypothetical protein